MMRTMGVDLGNPGGLVILSDDAPGKPHMICAGSWARTTGLQLQRLIVALGRDHHVDLVATERPGQWGRRTIGMSQRGKQELVRAACEALQVPLVDYQPKEIKKAVTGRGGASKLAVERCMRFAVEVDNPREPITEHIWDAAAVALVALNRERTRRKLTAALKPRNGNP